jgi:hypothetical protein
MLFMFKRGSLTSLSDHLLFSLGEPRNRAQTQRTLDSYLEKATVIGSKTELKKARTQTGIKDTVQEYHFEKLFSSYKGKLGPHAKQQALDAAVAELPDDITSPVWRLQGKSSIDLLMHLHLQVK